MAPRPKLFADVLALPEGQRAELVCELLESLDGGEAHVDADERWATEIEQRARAVVDGSAELLDYDAVMDELRALDNG
jgi:putative addiction module component (TIGR02574 family)